MVRVTVIPTARPTFAVEAARQRAAAARDLLAGLGADVRGPAGLVMTGQDVAAAAAFAGSAADLVINVCASFSDASPAIRLYRGLAQPVLLWAFREPGPVGDRLWLNSLCGANLFGHAIVQAGGSVRLVYGDPGEAATRETVAAALSGQLPAAGGSPDDPGRPRGTPEAARRAVRALRGAAIGLIGGAPPGFTPCEYDPHLLGELFGISVRTRTTGEFFQQVRGVDAAARDAERAAAEAAQPTLRTVDPAQVSLAAAVTAALRDWVDREALAAVAVRCWPEFPTRLGVCPCSALSRLADAGTPTACERDVYGAVTMLLLEALGSGPAYLVDTVDLDTAANVVRLWHCGSAATRLAADPARAAQSVHCNRRIGVAGNFPLRTGRVIMARLAEAPGGRLRMLIAAGESLPEPNRFQGNTAAVRLDTDAGEFVHGLVTGGFPHHTVLAWTDVRAGLRAAADQLGIPVCEW
jgi:L-fucose isomerase-like protein